MAKIIRLTAKNGMVREVPAGARIRLDAKFAGAKIEVVDVSTGVVTAARTVRTDGKDIILSFVEDGREIEARLEGAAESSSSENFNAEHQSAPFQSAEGQAGSERASASPVTTPDQSRDVQSSGLPATTIALGVLGLGALGGLVAAAGGGASGSSNNGGGSGGDTTPPAAPTGLDLAAGDDSGASNSDNVTSQTSGLTIAGTAEANARVELFDGATSLGTVTADGSGHFSLDVTLAAGAHSISAKSTDAAGNVGVASAALSITVDTTAPVTPTGLDLAAADDRGASNSDNLTSQTSGLTITGAAEANARVELFDGATSLGTATVDGSGNFSLDVALAAGTHTITAKAVDSAGNVSSTSTPLSITVDTTAPAITLQAANSSSKTITLNYDGALDATNPPAASNFAVTTGGVDNPVASVSINGSVLALTLTNAFTPGAVTVSYTDPAGDAANAIQDLAGNDAGSFSSGLVADGYIRGAKVYIDTNGNGVVDPASDYYAGLTDANGNFFLSGDAPSGTIIAIGGVNIDTGVPNTTPLKAPAGSTTINPLTTLVQAVIDSNPGTDTASASASVATALGLNPSQDLTQYDPISAGDVTAQKAAAQVATLTALAEGDAGAGSNVLSNLASQITSAASGSTQVNLSDADTISAALSGTSVSAATVGAIATASRDIAAASDINAVSSAQANALDRVSPAAPLEITLTAATDSGLAGDAITNNAGPAVRVAIDNSSVDGSAAVAGDRLIVRSGPIEIGTVVLSAANILDGYVEVSLTELTAGTQQLTAQLVDKAGNLGTVSDPYVLTIDLTNPAAATINRIAGDDVINSSEQSAVISGTAEANASIAITLSGSVRTATADASGNWSYTLQASDITAMGQGAETISVTAIDAAGNVSSATTRNLSIDTQASAVTATIVEALDNVDPATGVVSSGGTSNDNTLTLNGTLSAGLAAGDKLAVYDGTTLLGFASVTGTNWTFTTPGLANSSHRFTARVDDAAGNASNASTDYAVTVDATVPTATVAITGGTDDVVPVSGALANGGVANDAAPVINGTVSGALASGDVIRIYENGVALGSATVAGSTWTFQLPELADGSHSFKAVVEGAGGNQGAFSNAFALNIDTSAPVLPIIRAVAGNDVINGSEQSAVISGTAEANASIAITLGGNVRTTTADGSGNWAYTLQASDITAMGQGAESISVTATDAAGNVSAIAQRNIAVDTQAPGLPTIATIAGNDVINVAEQSAAISGTAEPNATIAITLGGNVRTVTADGSGNWIYSVQPGDIIAMGQGGELVSVTGTDAAGNVSSAATRTISVDTKAPNLPIIAAVAGDNIINAAEQAVAISGTAEANASIAITLGGNVRTVMANASGNWSYTLQAEDVAAMGQGAETFSVVATDAAGNSSASASRSVSVDTIAPTASVSISDTSITVGETALVAVTFSEAVVGFTNADVIADNGTLSAFTTNDGGKTWTATYTPNVDVEDTTNLIKLSASYTDVSSNLGSAADSTNFGIDTLPNRAPTVAATQSVTTSEDVAKQVTVSASDADGDTLSWSAGAASHGTVSGGTDGVFTYTPTADYAGSDSFTVTVSDGQGGSRQQVVSVSVSASEDEATGSVSVSGTAAEGSTVSASVSATDVDGAITDKTYQWQVSSDGSTGWSNLSGATAQSYAIASDQSQVGKYLRVVATTTDALGGTTTFTSAATTAIANVNDAPVVASAIADQSSAEDTAWSYQVPVGAFSDVDGDALSYSATLADGSALPTWLTFNGATRTFSGTPPQDYNGTTSLKVTASDGSLSASDTFVLTVTGVNDAPVVANAIADQSSAEDTAWSYQVPVGAFSDVDGDSLSYSATLGNGSALPTWLTFNGTTRTFSGTPPQDFAGDISLKVTASDGTLSASDTFTLSVTAVNDAPTVAATQSVTTSEDVARQVTVSASDADGDALSWSAGAASHGTVSGGTDGVFTYTPTADYAGSDSFTVTVSDGQGGSRQQVVSVSVSAAEDEATGSVSVSGTAAEGSTVSASVSATDVDGAITDKTYQWQVSSDGSTGWSNLSGATAQSYAIASDQSQVGKYLRVVATTTDALGGTTTFTSAATTAIANVNDAPVVASAIADQSSAEDTAWSYVVPAGAFSDVDGDALSYSATLADGSALPTWLTFNGATRTFSGTPPQDYNGTTSLKVTASDGSLSASDTFVLTVTGVNDAPVVANAIADQSSAEDTAWSYQVPVGAFSDVDGDSLSYSATLGNGSALPTWLTFNGTTRTFSGTPPQDFAGDISLKVTASDGTLSASDTFTLSVTAVNDAPTVAATQSVTTSEDVARQVTVSASDADGDALSWSAGAASHGTVSGGTDGVFTYTPTADYAGSDSFTVTVSDGQGGSRQQVVSVSVSAAEDEAVGGVSVSGTVAEGGSVSASVTATDVDGAIAGTTYQWQVSSDGSTGWNNLSGATAASYAIASDQSQVGKYLRVVATTTDALGGATVFTSDATAAIANVNDAPVVASNVADQSSAEDAAWSYQVPANVFSDVDGDALSYSATLADGSALPTWLTFNGATRTFSGTPPQDYNGTTSLKVTASDGSLSVSDTFVLTVTGVNDAPVVANAIADQSSAEDTAWSYQVPVGAFSDVDGDSLSYSATLGNGSALPTWLTFNGTTRTFSGTPPQDFAGDISLKVTASDGTLSASDTFTLSVAPTPVTIANGQTYQARGGVADAFAIDASQSIFATIVGFEEGDILRYLNNGDNGLGGVDNAILDDGEAVLLVGNSSIALTSLASDYFGDEASFEVIYGANAISYVI